MPEKPPEMITHYTPGMNQISASDLNAYRAAAIMLRYLSVEPPLGAHIGHNSLTIYLKEKPVRVFLGIIVNEGPGSEEDYTDERYWFKRAQCSNSSGTEHGALSFSALAGEHHDFLHSTATNIAELLDNTHLLDVGSIVTIFELFDLQSPPIRRYYFWRGGPHVEGTHVDPAVILPTNFETEAAQTDSWERSNPPSGKDGVKIRLMTRMAYNHTGDEKLYAYYRIFWLDTFGQVDIISGEVRIEVDAPGECP